MKFYGSFEKVEPQDDGTIKVWGIASSEAVDGAKEIVRADAMKKALPGYMEFANIREMHGKTAAGVCFEASVDDKGMTHIGAHIVDPISVKKVQTNVLKGFSIGGEVTDRDTVNKGTITGINLTEISLVDRPCNPDARISLWKADMFHGEPSGEQLDIFANLAKTFHEMGLDESAILAKIEARQLAKIAEREDANPKEGENKYGDVRFADEKNKKYPIDTEAHIRAAWNYINKPKNSGKYDSSDAASIKAKIVAAWKAKIDSAGPPSADKALTAGELRKMDCEARAALLLANPDAQDILKSLSILAGNKLEKGMWTISTLACLIGNLFDLQQCVEMEAAYEGDSSILPEELEDAVKDLGEILAHMVAEETEELFPNEDEEGDDVDFDSLVVAMAAQVSTLKKASETILAKAGAQHSKATMEKLQSMHDTLKGMAPVCGEDDGEDESEKAAKASLCKALHAKPEDDLAKKAESLHKALHEATESLSKVTKERDEANEVLVKAAEQIKLLKAEPLPAKGVIREGLHVVQKGEVETTIEPVLDSKKQIDKAATGIKLAFATGGRTQM